LPFWKKVAARIFYRYDLRQYQKYLDVFYLPSLYMLPYVPAEMKMHVKELPPGAGFAGEMNSGQENRPPAGKDSLHILYVGGIGSVYRIHLLLEAVKERPSVDLTICCRKEEWETYRPEYHHLLAPNIKVVHQSGVGLAELYQQASLVSLFIEPSEYRNFAMPVKLFEYIKFEKPIVATGDTAVGEFVEKHNIGWSVGYTASALLSLLDELLKDTTAVQVKKERLHAIVTDHTWEARARQVASDLSQL
jgi:glycosyltransferase involved in cell wall biosynthesis